jgi:hypothetical protein
MGMVINPDFRNCVPLRNAVPRVLFDVFLQGDPGVSIEGQRQGFLNGDPDISMGFIVENDFIGIGFAGEIKKDEVPLLPKSLIEDKFLKDQELDVVNIQVGLFLDLAAQGLFHALPQFDVPAGDDVGIPPFMGLHQEELLMGVEDESANGRRGVGLWGHGFDSYVCSIESINLFKYFIP